MPSTLTERLGTHVRNLGRLSVSILEHYVGEITGEGALKILGEPYEREKRLLLLTDALSNTEDEIRQKKLLPVEYLDVQFENQASFADALESFQHDIDITKLTETLRAEFTIAFPDYPADTLCKNAEIFASILQKKIVSVSDETVAGRVTATTLLEIKQLLDQQISSRSMDTEELELSRKMIDLLQQLVEQKNMTSPSIKKSSKRANQKSTAKSSEGNVMNDEIVFVCYAHEDVEQVRALVSRLEQDKIKVWVDYENLLGGSDWDLEISKAIRSAQAVLIFLSSVSVQKEGYVQKEIKRALDKAQEKPEGDIYIIPVRLEECLVPESLQQWQYLDLFQEHGYERLIKSLKVALERKENVSPVKKKNNQVSLSSSVADIQRAVYECRSINSQIEGLYRKSNFRGYKPGVGVEDNVDSLVEQYINTAGTLLNFLKNLGDTEGPKDGSSYSDQYWDVLYAWYHYPKSKEEQKEFVDWLKSIGFNLNNIQKIKLETLLHSL